MIENVHTAAILQRLPLFAGGLFFLYFRWIGAIMWRAKVGLDCGNQ